MGLFGISDKWQLKGDTWHVTHDMWHMTYDTWHMKKIVFLDLWSLSVCFCLLWYLCYYPHTLRDWVSPVWGICMVSLSDLITTLMLGQPWLHRVCQIQYLRWCSYKNFSNNRGGISTGYRSHQIFEQYLAAFGVLPCRWPQEHIGWESFHKGYIGKSIECTATSEKIRIPFPFQLITPLTSFTLTV